MIKFITGAKGSGKTKWLIDNANEEYKSGNGNIAFLDTDDEHIFSLDYNVRLINVQDYEINSLESLFGFLGGLQAMDYDLEKIYIDSIYKLVKMDDKGLNEFYNKVNKIAEEQNVAIYINIDRTIEEMPENLKEFSEEATL